MKHIKVAKMRRLIVHCVPFHTKPSRQQCAVFKLKCTIGMTKHKTLSGCINHCCVTGWQCLWRCYSKSHSDCLIPGRGGIQFPSMPAQRYTNTIQTRIHREPAQTRWELSGAGREGGEGVFSLGSHTFHAVQRDYVSKTPQTRRTG